VLRGSAVAIRARPDFTAGQPSTEVGHSLRRQAWRWNGKSAADSPGVCWIFGCAIRRSGNKHYGTAGRVDAETSGNGHGWARVRGST